MSVEPENWAYDIGNQIDCLLKVHTTFPYLNSSARQGQGHPVGHYEPADVLNKETERGIGEVQDMAGRACLTSRRESTYFE